MWVNREVIGAVQCSDEMELNVQRYHIIASHHLHPPV
jgi:hypothetical protein